MTKTSRNKPCQVRYGNCFATLKDIPGDTKADDELQCMIYRLEE